MPQDVKPLDGFERWMVARSLGYVSIEGLPAVLERLRAQGYMRVAGAVEAGSINTISKESK